MKIKFLSISALIAFTAVSVIFLWHEDLNVNYPLNDEKFSNYATVVGAIGTSMALLFLAMQLREMEIARKASYKPLLIPGDARFYTRDSPVSTDEYFPTRPLFFLDPEMKNPVPVTFLLHNMGKGIARNIKVRWEYSVDEIKSHVAFKYQIPKYFGRPAPQTISFVEESSHSEARIPNDYLITCGIQVNNRENPQLRPKLTMVLRYQDLHDSIVIENKFRVFTFSLDGSLRISFIEL